MLLFAMKKSFALQSLALTLHGMIQSTSHLPLFVSKVAAFQWWYLHASGTEVWQLMR